MFSELMPFLSPLIGALIGATASIIATVFTMRHQARINKQNLEHQENVSNATLRFQFLSGLYEEFYPTTVQFTDALLSHEEDCKCNLKALQIISHIATSMIATGDETLTKLAGELMLSSSNYRDKHNAKMAREVSYIVATAQYRFAQIMAETLNSEVDYTSEFPSVEFDKKFASVTNKDNI